MDKYINILNDILSANNVCKSHGIDHGISVMNNAQKALNYYCLNDHDHKLVLLGALLHDVDDKKFFPLNTNYENLRYIMHSCNDSDNDIEIVVKIVDLVSSSKNADNIPTDLPEWYLIPRYADRIEAIGIVGIERCYQYNKTAKSKLYLPTTIIPLSESHIYEIASLKRYNSYTGNSISMIDHYYDKLIRLTFFPIQNEYFDKECEIKRKPLIDFLLYFKDCIQNNKIFTDENIMFFITSLK